MQIVLSNDDTTYTLYDTEPSGPNKIDLDLDNGNTITLSVSSEDGRLHQISITLKMNNSVIAAYFFKGLDHMWIQNLYN